MGSRIGSIAIFVVISGIVAAVAVLILTLDVLNSNEPNAPLVVISVDDGELVLLEDPQSITVTISSGNPVATLELFVDGQSLVSVLPAYSADRGAYIGTFVWTPTRLGFAELRIVALDAEGVETERQIRVEVTDDQARVAAALRLQVLGISPLQQIVTGTTVRLAISATGSQPIERFDMLVDGNRVVSVTPALVDNEYLANIDWTPGETGEVEVTIVAIDAAGREERQATPVVLVPQGGALPQDDAAASSGSQSQTPGSTNGQTSSGIGAAQIDSPTNAARFMLGDDFAFDVEISAPNVTVSSALLYLTPISPDNTLGNSVLIHSAEGPADPYAEVVEDIQRWITNSGSYELQLVVFTPEDDRYDDRIVIHVIAEGAADDAAQQQSSADPDSDQPGQEALRDEVDIAIVTARQTADDLRRLNVSITNASDVDIERADVLISVVDAASGVELGSAAVVLSMAPDDLRSIPLDLDLDDGVDVQALIVLESAIDTTSANNTFQVSLSAPGAVGDGSDGQQEDSAQDADTDQPTDTPVQQPAELPDLTFLDTQSTRDGYVLFTVVNQGDGPAESFFVVIADSAETELEVIPRRSADVSPLAAGGVETLASNQPHSGEITMTIVTTGNLAESDTSNNTITMSLDE